MRGVIEGYWQRLLHCVALGAALSAAHGSGADDDYLALYHELRQAEQLEAQGDLAQACVAYRQLHDRLMGFERSYPSWHPEIVAFRLRVIRAGVKRVCQESPEASEPRRQGDPAPPPVETEDLLRARLRQLEQERDELKARLREALAAQPAGAHSPEMTRAEERIRTLEKEVALLRFTAQPGPTDVPGVSHQPTDTDELALTEQVRALKDELELERQKVAALEATASVLGARLVKSPATKPADPEPPVADAELESGDASVVEQGRALLEAGEIEEAILVLGGGAESPSASAELLGLLSSAFLSKGMMDPAESVARRALASDATCTEAHRVMARLCLLRSPPARGLARWHYHEARRHGLVPDPTLEGL